MVVRESGLESIGASFLMRLCWNLARQIDVNYLDLCSRSKLERRRA